MRQIDRVIGNNIKPDKSIRQIDRVGNNIQPNFKDDITIDEKDLPLLKEIQSKELEARRLMNKGFDNNEDAIKILKENISYGIYCESYIMLSGLYQNNKEYDKEIDVLKKAMNIFEEKNLEVPQRLLRLFNYAERKKNLKIHIKNNEKGRKLEKDGDIDGAIKAYRENLNLRTDIPFTYERLYILYRKKKDYESEIEVINIAIEVYEENGFNSSAIDKLKKRLQKAQKLYEKEKNQTKLI